MTFNLITFKIRQKICKNMLLQNNNHFQLARWRLDKYIQSCGWIQKNYCGRV